MNPSNPHDWLLKADRDFGLASLALQHTPEYPDLICYHFQQSAEKCLKALVIHLGLPLRRTHDLEDLLDLIALNFPDLPPELYQNARILNDYSVHIRYPDPSGDPTPEDVQEASVAARFIRDFAFGAIER